MFTQRHYPSKIAPAELDQYLARGWFRMGQLIFTTRFIFFFAKLYSVIWLRLPLEEYVPKKRLRKLSRRNHARFRVAYGPMRIDREKEMLYIRYRIDRERLSADSLYSSLLDFNGKSIYNTWETRVYDGDKLIAFSFFDLGKDSAESITGVYDPDYQQFSLGIFTMLLEVEFLQARGMRYYYPGYIVPGYHPFAYKTRLGEEQLEYYMPDEHIWEPYLHFDETETPAIRMTEKLSELSVALRRAGIPALERIYPPHDLHMHMADEEGITAMAFPLFIQVYPSSLALSQAFCIHFDFRTGEYVLQQYIVYSDIAKEYNLKRSNPKDYRRICTNILIEDQHLLRSPSVAYLVDHIRSKITRDGTVSKKD